MPITKTQEIILIAIFLGLSIPAHELGHYIVAVIDDVQIYDFRGFISFNGTHFLGPAVIINEFTFSSIWTLLLCYFGGFLITFIPGLVASIILYRRKSDLWYFISTWWVSAPLISLGDFDRIFELLWLNDAIKWMYFMLGVYMMCVIPFIKRKREELINASND